MAQSAEKGMSCHATDLAVYAKSSSSSGGCRPLGQAGSHNFHQPEPIDPP